MVSLAEERLTLDAGRFRPVELGPLQPGVHVEQVGHERHVEFAVS